MASKSFTVSYEPSAYGEKVAIYAVNPNALYAEVETIQIANADSSPYEVDIFWVDESAKEISSQILWGDGSVLKSFYNYGGSGLNIIIKDAKIPKGTSLTVLKSSLYLDPKDFIFIRPAASGSDNAFKPLVVVTEHFEDTTYINTSVDLTSINNLLNLTTY